MIKQRSEMSRFVLLIDQGSKMYEQPGDSEPSPMYKTEASSMEQESDNSRFVLLTEPFSRMSIELSPMFKTEPLSTIVQEELPTEIKLRCERPLSGWLETKCTRIVLRENGIFFGRLQNPTNYTIIVKFNINVAHTDITKIKLSKSDQNHKQYLFFTITKYAAEKIATTLKIDMKKYDIHPKNQPTVRFHFETDPTLAIHVMKYVLNYCKSTRKSVLEFYILEPTEAEGMPSLSFESELSNYIFLSRI